MNCEERKINIDEPRYDQDTYVGRAKHFFLTTNPLNVFVSSKKLEEARCIVQRYKCGETIPGGLTENQLWRAKTLYDSAFHPDTGEKMFLIGRMSAQVPMNMLITGGMITFYKSTPAVIFWQWLNQSFNALVNYTNRSGDVVQSDKQIFTSYVLATSAAVGTAVGLNSIVKKMPPIVGRMVPFAAVAAANCVNIPLMRAQELKHGTPIYDINGNKLGYSRVAAQYGIGQVILSRIAMALPGMVLTPVVMDYLEKRGTLCRYPWLALPASVGILGLCLTFATPLACAFFKQRASIPFTHLEEDLKIAKKVPLPSSQILFLQPKIVYTLLVLVLLFLLLTFVKQVVELKHGTPIYDINGNKLGYSRVAAQYGIGQVILSRIAMALPGMVLTPVVMDYLEKRGTLCRYPWLALPASVGILGLCLTFATPLACAFFKQRASIPFTHLEEDLKSEIKKKYDIKDDEHLFYNKGL